MKKLLFVSFFMVVILGGCEEYLIGAGVGTAGKDALEEVKANTEAKIAELEARYQAVVLELKEAPDPNTVAAKKAVLDKIVQDRLVYEGVLLGANQALALPELGGEGRSDHTTALITGGVGLLTLLVREFMRKNQVKGLNDELDLLGRKYSSMKRGKANLGASDPEAEVKLHKLIGIERAALNV